MEGTAGDAGVACLLGPNGSKDLRERNAGIPVDVDVLGLECVLMGKEEVEAVGTVPVDARRADGRAEERGCFGRFGVLVSDCMAAPRRDQN